MGNFGGLLIIGIGILLVIMGVKGTWVNLFPNNFFNNFLQIQNTGTSSQQQQQQPQSTSPTQVIPSYPSNQH